MSAPADRRPCPFCHIDRPLVAQTDLVVALRDAFPSSEGHLLVVPRRHVGRVTELTAQESAALWTVATRLLAEQRWEGATIGINDGPAAGQTVPHVHLHLIPRHHGDVADARGGVRWVLPATADYWSAR